MRALWQVAAPPGKRPRLPAVTEQNGGGPAPHPDNQAAQGLRRGAPTVRSNHTRPEARGNRPGLSEIIHLFAFPSRVLTAPYEGGTYALSLIGAFHLGVDLNGTGIPLPFRLAGVTQW